MTVSKGITFAISLLLSGTSSLVLAQEGAPLEPPYYNADGTRTSDLDSAAATWRALPEFQADHSKAQIKAEYAYARGITGQGVSVGVLDSGIDPNHQAFTGDGKLSFINISGQLGEGSPFRPNEAVFDGTPAYRLASSGHGSHVGGSIAAPKDNDRMMGVEFDASVISGTLPLGSDPLKVMRAAADLDAPDTFSPTVAAISSQRARIFNASFGSTLAEGPDQFNLTALPQDASLAAVLSVLEEDREVAQYYADAVRANDKLVVFAAGNAGKHAGFQPSVPLLIPEAEPNWLSVVNVGVDGLTRAESSNICGYTKAWCLSAPGTNIISAGRVAEFTPAAQARLDAITPGPILTVPNTDTRYDAALSTLLSLLNLIELPTPLNLPPLAENATPQEIAERAAIVSDHNAQRQVPLGYLNLPPNTLVQVFSDAFEENLLQNYAGYLGNLLVRENEVSLTDFMEIIKSYIFPYVSDVDNVSVVEKYYDRYTQWGEHYFANGLIEDPIYLLQLELNRRFDNLVTYSNDYVSSSGTSMAAPQVSDGLALLQQRFPYMQTALLRDTLLTTASDLGEAGVDAEFGWGMINLQAAMDGPGALLRATDVTLPTGLSDEWKNNITDGSEHLDDNYRGSLRKLGGGTLTLSGQNSYLGDTEVQEGHLIINGALLNSQALVSGSSVLGGSGRLHSSVVGQGGTLSPGNSPGAITVANDLTFRKGSTLLIESSVDLVNVDRVDVGGSVLIEGGLVRLLADQRAWSWSTSANIISSAGAVSGTFDEVSSNLAFLTPELLYRANGVDLLVRRNDVRFRDVALTPNQHATAGALENLAVTIPIFTAALVCRSASIHCRAKFMPALQRRRPMISTISAAPR